MPTKAIIALSTKGCQYARYSGTCSICGHPSSSIWDQNISSDETFEEFVNSLSLIRKENIHQVNIYCSGSFFDDNEISNLLRKRILEKISKEDWIEEIKFESLPHYVYTEQLQQISNILQKKRITIGTGLDCSSDILRYILTHKFIKNNCYSSFVKKCKSVNIIPEAYLVVKPPYLFEEEAIWETSEAIHTAVLLGFSKISLEPIALQEGTLQEYLWFNNLYNPPTIWTVFNSIKRWNNFYPNDLDKVSLEVGGEVFTPAPYMTYDRCKKCVEEVNSKLYDMKINFSFEASTDYPKNCCKHKIDNSKKISLNELKDRIIEQHHLLENKTAISLNKVEL